MKSPVRKPVPVPSSPFHTTSERPPRSPILFYAAVVLVVVAGIAHAAGMATVNDDAFISFRYAQQFVNGNGLVYNPGERVEGYTNFLWTILIAAGMGVGADPVSWSIFLGIFFYAGTLLLASGFARRMTGGDTGILSTIPIAALALALHRDFNVYATSGLETSMQTFLVTMLFVVLARRSDARAFLLAGFILTASLMTRPDAIVFVAAIVVFTILGKKEIIGRLVRLGIPLLLLFIPYWLVRWDYYGFFFPNAFYAKSIELPYYTQGLTYTWMYVSSYYPLMLLLPLAVYHIIRRRRAIDPVHSVPGPAAGEASRAGKRSVRLGLLLVISFTLFIVRIGGDFMFARFFIPITPIAYLLLEMFIRRVSPAWTAYSLAALLVAGTFFRYDYFSEKNHVGYIADEWQWYPPGSLGETKKSGALLKRYFDGLPVQVAFWGGQGRLMYYAAPYHAIETSAGLTDTFIAHMRLEERGRPGHEKSAPVDYLVRRGVNFYIGPLGPLPPGGPALNLIVFDSLAARIVAYRNPVMDSLRKYPGVYFQPMPELLDEYVRTLGGKTPDDVAADYGWFREFYFRHNDDTTRERAFMEYLGAYGRPPG